MGSEKRQFETLKFTFSQDDIRELGQAMARETQGVYDLEKRKKEIDAELAANIKAANGRVESLTAKINNGYEMREVEVLILLDEPRAGLKRVVRVDNNEHLRDEAMTFEEMQRGFGFEKE